MRMALKTSRLAAASRSRCAAPGSCTGCCASGARTAAKTSTSLTPSCRKRRSVWSFDAPLRSVAASASSAVRASCAASRSARSRSSFASPAAFGEAVDFDDLSPLAQQLYKEERGWSPSDVEVLGGAAGER